MSLINDKIDNQFNNWWTKHKGRKPMPEGWVSPVEHALQGHPESLRPWEQHMNKILTKLIFKNTTHKRNAHSTTTKGHKVPVLYQVDDFSVACTVESMRKAVIEEMGNT